MQETTPSDNSRPYNLMSNLEWFTASEALLKWKSTRVVTRPKSTAWRTSWHTRSTADGVLYPPLNSDCLESKISLATINSVICRWRTRVKKRFSERVSLGVIHIIWSETLGKTLGETFRAKKSRQKSGESFGSDYMHDSRRDSLGDSLFLRGNFLKNLGQFT